MNQEGKCEVTQKLTLDNVSLPAHGSALTYVPPDMNLTLASKTEVDIHLSQPRGVKGRVPRVEESRVHVQSRGLSIEEPDYRHVLTISQSTQICMSFMQYDWMRSNQLGPINYYAAEFQPSGYRHTTCPTTNPPHEHEVTMASSSPTGHPEVGQPLCEDIRAHCFASRTGRLPPQNDVHQGRGGAILVTEELFFFSRLQVKNGQWAPNGHFRPLPIFIYYTNADTFLTPQCI